MADAALLGRVEVWGVIATAPVGVVVIEVAVITIGVGCRIIIATSILTFCICAVPASLR